MTNTAAQAAEQTRAAWEQIAARYDDHVTPTHLAIAQRSLQQIGLRPGSRLLDVAAGNGEALDQLLRERAGGPGPALTHPVLLGTGTKPSADPTASPTATSIAGNRN